MSHNFARSEIFEIIAEGAVRFFVHEDLLTSQSPPLAEASRGVWTEAVERKIVLSEWDADTVNRLVQYLYTRDYTFPKPTPFPAETTVPVDTNPRPSPFLQDPGGTDHTAASEDKSQYSDSDDQPDSRHSGPLTPLGKWYEWSTTPKFQSLVHSPNSLDKFRPAQFNFGEPLMAHAKVYVLAHYKSINGLKKLACHRLTETLAHLDPMIDTCELLRAVVDLAVYVYMNTDSLSASKEKLRDVVSQFLALNLEILLKAPEGIQLFSNGGDLVTDVMKKMCRRLPGRKIELRCLPSSGKRFIAKLRVVRRHKPKDRVTEASGARNNVTCDRSPKVRLVPEYTIIPAEASTVFTISTDLAGHTADDNLAEHSGDHCYIDSIAEGLNPQKITEVKLVRLTQDRLHVELGKSYDGFTADIIRGKGPMAIHLVWRSVCGSNVRLKTRRTR